MHTVRNRNSVTYCPAYSTQDQKCNETAYIGMLKLLWRLVGIVLSPEIVLTLCIRYKSCADSLMSSLHILRHIAYIISALYVIILILVTQYFIVSTVHFVPLWRFWCCSQTLPPICRQFDLESGHMRNVRHEMVDGVPVSNGITE